MRKTLPVLLVFVALTAGGCSSFVSVETRSPAPPESSVPPRHGVASHPAHLGIPPGHLPPPGQCRIWVPGRPPGHQPPAGECGKLENEVPVGAWLVYRPTKDRKHVRVSFYDTSRPRSIVSVALYHAATGNLVRVEAVY